jgi:hypothetical protein
VQDAGDLNKARQRLWSKWRHPACEARGTLDGETNLTARDRLGFYVRNIVDTVVVERHDLRSSGVAAGTESSSESRVWLFSLPTRRNCASCIPETRRWRAVGTLLSDNHSRAGAVEPLKQQGAGLRQQHHDFSHCLSSLWILSWLCIRCIPNPTHMQIRT